MYGSSKNRENNVEYIYYFDEKEDQKIFDKHFFKKELEIRSFQTRLSPFRMGWPQTK